VILRFTLICAQPLSTEDAEKLLRQERYSEALPILLEKFKTDSSDIRLNSNIAVCYINSRSQKVKSIDFFERTLRAAARSGSAFPLSTYKMLGDAYQLNYDFDRAIINYERYRDKLNLSADPKESEEIGWKIDMCRVGKALDGLSVPPIELKKNKSKSPSVAPTPGNYSAFLSPDQSKMTFTFNRGQKGGKNKDEYRYYAENIIPADSTAKTDSIVPRKKNSFETTVATSFDGQIVLNYRDNNGAAELFVTCLNGNTWTRPEKLNKGVNYAGWEENECITPDGQLMFFTSDRKGGYGGKDIYFCKKISENEWGKAENAGPVINSPFDEEAPFIHPDGVTLYYSTNGRNKEHQFEIYSSVFNAKLWSPPVNIGFPIDTTRDQLIDSKITEAVVKVDESKKIRKKRKKDKTIEKINETRDNYLISFNNPNGKPLTLLKGEFLSNEASRGPVKITVSNNETGGMNSVFYSDSLSNKYSIILPPGNNNNITYGKQGYMIFSENIDLTNKNELFEKRLALQLFKPEEEARMIINNIFFDPGTANISRTSGVALKDLTDLLKHYPGIVAEFSNTIVSKDELKKNSRLARERAEALVKYLETNGIEKDRLIARGDAMKPKHSPDKKMTQWMEMKIIENKQTKELLTTQ
jgi:flagellar motor protein MotB